MPHLSWGILSVSKPPDRRPNRRGRVKMVNVEVKSFSTPDTIKELPEGTGEARTVDVPHAVCHTIEGVSRMAVV